MEGLRAVDGLLSEEVLGTYPRLALVRCVALTLSGDIAGAKRVYGAAEAGTAGFTRDREGGDDQALLVDHLLVYGLVEMCGCAPYGEISTRMLPLGMGVAVGQDTAVLFRGMFSLGLCFAHNQGAAFDSAAEWAERARSALGRSSPYLAHVDFQLGSIAMARGQSDEAQACYQRALRVARASHLRDAGAMMLGEVLAGELAFERSVGVEPVDRTRLSPRLLGECGAWLDIYAASTEVSAELGLLRGGPRAALALVEDARDYARRTGRAPIERFLSALRVSVLLAGGRVEEAERAWRFDRLPEGVGECIDLTAQSWREAEIIACVRLRLLIARGAFDAARDLAGALDAMASERQLVRTRMRGLALAMVLECRAGNDARAREHLVAYLRLYDETGYARPFAREGPATLALLDGVAPVPGTVAGAAARLRASLDGEAEAWPPLVPLSDREFEVLALLERHSDKEIAKRLRLTFYGVRYRISCLFAKLGARGRFDAVHRARMRGLLPPADDA
ncbi:MAG: LuxR C-terminal-related transcriptional regulator [Paracoccaceae bacterium]|nr:LuxR C-terminal-related transcriptional regulator [Paracoccaceae bacterium]